MRKSPLALVPAKALRQRKPGGKLNPREVKEMLLANGTRYQHPVKRILCRIDFSIKRVSQIRHVTLPDFNMAANIVAEA